MQVQQIKTIGESCNASIGKARTCLNQEDGYSNIFCPEAQKSGGFDNHICWEKTM